MLPTPASADSILARVLKAAATGNDALREALDEHPAPIYVTDTEGVITYFNPACIDFSGRTPALREDRWCVTWKLYTERGEPLPHENCPMAAAIRDRRPVRGVSAVAERPDGTRVSFLPFPTPYYSEDGEFRGAVNLLIDLEDGSQAEFLREQARRCRRLADSVGDEGTRATLTRMASEYDERASKLRPRSSKAQA
jgi:PAS domain S-box-containing protein